MVPSIRNRTSLVVVGALAITLAMLTSLVEAGDLAVMVMAREVVARKVVGSQAGISRRQFLPEDLHLLPLLVALHPGVRAEGTGAHQLEMSVPIVT